MSVDDLISAYCQWALRHQGDALGWFGAMTNVWANISLVRKSSSGWALRLVSNAAWILYSIHELTPPLLANHVTFAAINVWGWHKWRQEEKAKLQ